MLICYVSLVNGTQNFNFYNESFVAADFAAKNIFVNKYLSTTPKAFVVVVVVFFKKLGSGEF